MTNYSSRRLKMSRYVCVRIIKMDVNAKLFILHTKRTDLQTRKRGKKIEFLIFFNILELIRFHKIKNVWKNYFRIRFEIKIKYQSVFT